MLIRNALVSLGALKAPRGGVGLAPAALAALLTSKNYSGGGGSSGGGTKDINSPLPSYTTKYLRAKRFKESLRQNYNQEVKAKLRYQSRELPQEIRDKFSMPIKEEPLKPPPIKELRSPAQQQPKAEAPKVVETMTKSEPKLQQLQPTKDTGGNGNKGGGSDEENAKNKSTEESWKKIKYSLIAMGVTFTGALGAGVVYFGKPKSNLHGDIVIDEYSKYFLPVQYVYRAIDEINYYNKLIKEPSREKLLPDPVKPPYYQPPYTLILEFTDVLVHPEWTYSTGWRFKKRPGLDQFLDSLYTHYEMVVYTAEMGMTVFPIMEALDKNNYINYKLVRDATNFVDGHHVKDLDKLNRDLGKVIVVDWNPKSTQLHQDNLFKISRWDGNDNDTELVDLTAFLLTISEWEIGDVRTVLRHYAEFEDPLGTFRERQRMLAAQQEQQHN